MNTIGRRSPFDGQCTELVAFSFGSQTSIGKHRALRQLQTTIPLLLPEQYLLHQKKRQGKRKKKQSEQRGAATATGIEWQYDIQYK